ncbi:MAG: hypothetical protein K6B51_04750 [Bacilli bacterium]|nr:hypothetical protein [Bacilli bacterium]
MKKGILCAALLCCALSSCKVVGPAVSSEDAQSSVRSVKTSSSYIEPEDTLPVLEIFNRHTGGYPRAGSFELEEFDSQAFVVDDYGTVTNEKFEFRMSPDALFLKDINHDGYRDFCMVHSDGSGFINYYVQIYDLHNEQTIFRISERFSFDYFLCLDNGNLKIKRCDISRDREDYGSGVFHFNPSRGVYVEWENKYQINDFSFSIGYANPSHTPLRIKEKKGVYYVTVDTYSVYVISIVLDAKDMDLLPEYSIVSVNTGESRFYWGGTISKKKTCYYEGHLYFYGNEKTYKADVNISGIEKRFVFEVDDTGAKPTRIKDLYPWAKNITADDVSAFRYDATIGYDGIRDINFYTNKSTFSKAVENLNLLAFESDPSFFVDLECPSELDCYYSYYYTVNGVENVIKALSNILIVGEKYYYLRNTMGYGSADHYSYGFDEKITSLRMKAVADGLSNKNIANLGDFEFAEKYNDHIYVKDDIKFSFMMHTREYYVLSPKVFISSNFRYYYEITTARDFSELFE